MATKQELLKQFNNYDKPILEKLLVIAESILSPLDTDLTQVDFASLVDLVFKENGLADTYFSEWTDRSKSDFGRFLVELFAVFSDKDFFYINHFSREAHATTAELYKNLLHKAISNGINPPSNRGAEAEFSLTFENGAAYTYERGDIQIGIDGVDGYVFSNKYEFTLAANSSTPEPTTPVQFIHGIIKRVSGEFNGRSIIINNPNIVDESINLVIDGDTYAEVESFADGDLNTKHFKVFYNEEGRGEIVFAQNTWGYTPAIGAVYEIEFLEGGGYEGNISAGTLNKVIECPDRQILNFTQNETTGGSNLLSKEDLRAQTINRQNHNDRTVNKLDVENIVRELDFVHNVHVDVVSNYIFIFVVPVSGVLSPAQETAIENYLRDGRLLMGYGLSISYPPVVPITTIIDVYVLNDANAQISGEVAAEVVQDYLNPIRQAEFGEGLKRGTLASLILQRVQKSQNVVFTECVAGLVPNGNPQDVAVLANQMIDYNNSNITVNIIGGQ